MNMDTNRERKRSERNDKKGRREREMTYIRTYVHKLREERDGKREGEPLRNKPKNV